MTTVARCAGLCLPANEPAKIATAEVLEVGEVVVVPARP
jgi:hypothetical protein